MCTIDQIVWQTFKKKSNITLSQKAKQKIVKIYLAQKLVTWEPWNKNKLLI